MTPAIMALVVSAIALPASAARKAGRERLRIREGASDRQIRVREAVSAAA